MKKILLFLIMSSVLISCKKNNKQNFEENLKKAKQGSSQSQIMSSVLICKKTDQQNFEENLKMAKQGNADAQYKLGNCYKFGKGTSKKVKKVIYWYKKSAKQGNPQAQYELGYWIQFHQLNSPSVNIQEFESDYWYSKKTRSAKEFKESVFWYTKSAEQGHAQAQYYLGICHEISNRYHLEISNKDPREQFKEAIYWYRKSAEGGCAKAQYHLANCILNMILPYKHRTLASIKEAASLFKNSAEQGNARSQYELGECYAYGRGIARDFKKAAYWYKKSLKQGNNNAKGEAEDCLEAYRRDSIYNNLPCTKIMKFKTNNRKVYVLGKNLTNSISNKVANHGKNFYAYFAKQDNNTETGEIILSNFNEDNKRIIFLKNKSNTFIKLNYDVFIPVVSITDIWFDKEFYNCLTRSVARNCGGGIYIHFSVNSKGEGKFIKTKRTM